MIIVHQYTVGVRMRHFPRVGCEALCLVFLVVLASIGVQAQESGIVGTVTDSSGAVLVGASVTARNVNTGEERQATTSSVGQFAVPNLQPGTYQVTGTKQGFESKVIDHVTLEVQAVRTVDFVLSPGAASEHVNV